MRSPLKPSVRLSKHSALACTASKWPNYRNLFIAWYSRHLIILFLLALNCVPKSTESHLEKDTLSKVEMGYRKLGICCFLLATLYGSVTFSPER